MQNKLSLTLTLALSCSFLAGSLRGSPYAAAVVQYNPGAGYVPGYTNAATVVGQPYANKVTPFDPAYKTNQILSIGAGGRLTVKFDHPLVHYPNGSRDFIIFGNSFFDVTNYSDPSNLWSTDGDVINDSGQTLVSVSRDGTNFYTLDPALAPAANYLFPTDGTGDFQLPADPALTPANFGGLTLAQMRLLYNGSAGGASYDTAWARDTQGNAVALPDIRYVRVDVTSNSAQIAGFAGDLGTVLAEGFSNNPAADGWQAAGDTNLFAWDAANQDLQVTWDSSQPNSFFYHPLGTIMTSNDAFSLAFDLQLNDAGTNADGVYQFELAIGFLNLSEAESTNFLRGTGDNVTNLAEFDYFPPDGQGDGPSLDATLIDSNGNYYFAYADVPLQFGATYHVTISHPAGSGTLTGEIFADGVFYTSLPQSPADIFTNPAMSLGDFRLDTVAVSSYSDAEAYGGSILARGVVKNLFITAPPPPAAQLGGSIVNNTYQARFWSRSNWNYTLEKSADLQTWLPLPPASAGTGAALTLLDTNAPGASAYYRVSATPQ